MPPRRTHIEPSGCVCIVWLLKRIVPSINIMVVRGSLLSCAVVVVVAVVIVVVIKSSPVGWDNIGASAIRGIAVSRHGV